MSNESDPNPSEIFDQLTTAADYLNGMKRLLTNSGWTEENAQILILHFIMGGNG